MDPDSIPMPDEFHGFGDDTPIPGRIKIITEGEGDLERVVKVVREKRRGRPKGSKEEDSLNVGSILEEKRRSGSVQPPKTAVYPTRPPHIPASPKVPLGTSSRPEVFLLGKLSDDLTVSKLPKTGPVLCCFLFHLENGLTKKEAAQKTLDTLKKSWEHHFGIRVIFGKDFESDVADESLKIISPDKAICEKIFSIHNEYKKLEQSSRKHDRAKVPSHLDKVDKFVSNVLEMPLNIARKNYETIFQEKSGIKDWKEDIEHLKKQMEKDQSSSCDSWDLKQQKKDDRKASELITADKKEQKTKEHNNELQE